MEDLDISKVIDVEKAIQNLSGEKLYVLMLPKFESSSLMPYLDKITKEFMAGDYD
jgi:hypothetical protein